MKYGLITGFRYPFANYGDFVQTMAIEYIYKLMAIPSENIHKISMDELSTYHGEKLLLPFNTFYTLIVESGGGMPKLSDDIEPIFLGVTLSDNSYRQYLQGNKLKESIDFFKKYEPVGCRDEYTRRLLTDNGVDAYLQGCITCVLPKRQIEPTETKSLLIDCPIEFLTFLPDEIKSNCEILANSFYVGNITQEEAYQKAKKHYEYISKTAGLIITSRYHISSPCYAMGIPVVFTKRVYDLHNSDVRLDTLNPFIKIYEKNNYSEICWDLKVEEFEFVKKIIIKIAMDRINGRALDMECVKIIEDFYKKRIESFYEENQDNSINYYRDTLQSFVKKYYLGKVKGSFWIWGAKPSACFNGRVNNAEYIWSENPNLTFNGWIDTYKKGTLGGYKIISPDEIDLSENEFIVITSENGLVSILEKIENMGLSKNQYIICCNQHITKEDLKRV